eukprot:TRINITY_DN17218_c0_g2_i1.p1 TRINITY_DN17218_c0_g2~~TRINITY_DN17218_c0_g2_i1.p1  ORF type:complete len:519 (-),score=106.53 TRINITY_DN17218_c0_g2_i1:108-1550(-)
MAGRHLGQSSLRQALGRDVRRQLRLVVAGLMGSGKSTLCRMLEHLLGGVWVNQDEFSHLGRRAKKAFLAEIEKEAQDSKVPVLIVDKINTMRQHRREITDAMNHGVGGDIVFVQFVHPRDSPDRLDHMVQLCLSRIQKRGEGHRTLLASNPKVKSILKMTAGGAEPMSADELCHFSARVAVDVTQSPTQSVMHVLSELERNDLLGRCQLDELITHERLDKALSITKSAEKKLAGSTSDDIKVERKADVWYWVLEFNAEATATVRTLWNAQSPGTNSLQDADDIHVTLMYVGGASDHQLSQKHPQLQDAAEAKKLRDRLQHLEGHKVEVEIVAVVQDDRVAAAEVTGVHNLCANTYPHITLAHRSGTPPVLSNDLLARRAANTDIKTGLLPWLAQLGLAGFEEPIRTWCVASGVTTADEICKRAEDVASALQEAGVGEDRLAAVRQTLAHGAPSALQETGVLRFKVPLKIQGKVCGRLRGQ